MLWLCAHTGSTLSCSGYVTHAIMHSKFKYPLVRYEMSWGSRGVSGMDIERIRNQEINMSFMQLCAPYHIIGGGVWMCDVVLGIIRRYHWIIPLAGLIMLITA